jgi:hypothetical protein
MWQRSRNEDRLVFDRMLVSSKQINLLFFQHINTNTKCTKYRQGITIRWAIRVVVLLRIRLAQNLPPCLVCSLCY